MASLSIKDLLKCFADHPLANHVREKPAQLCHWRVASREEPASNQFPADQGMLHRKSTFGKAVDVTLNSCNTGAKRLVLPVLAAPTALGAGCRLKQWL